MKSCRTKVNGPNVETLKFMYFTLRRGKFSEGAKHTSLHYAHSPIKLSYLGCKSKGLEASCSVCTREGRPETQRVASKDQQPLGSTKDRNKR